LKDEKSAQEKNKPEKQKRKEKKGNFLGFLYFLKVRKVPQDIDAQKNNGNDKRNKMPGRPIPDNGKIDRVRHQP
jgi:hypothetical protein